MKISKYWIGFGVVLLIWEIFWFARYNLTINIAQAIAKAIALYGFYLFLAYLLLTIIFILTKQKKKIK